MPNILANIAKMDSATTGTGTLTLGAAVTGYLTFANAGVTNGQVVTYAIEDYDVSGNIIAREVGAGTYSSTGPTLTRDTVYSSTNAGAKINCSGLQYVFVSLAKEDLATFGVLSAVNTWTANNYFTTGNVGIGTASPSGSLHVVGSSANFMDRAGSAHLLLRSGNGTVSSPTGILSTNLLGRVSFQGYDGTQWTANSLSGVAAFATENWSTTARGSQLQFLTTPNTTAAAVERMTIDQAGNVGIGTTAPSSRLTVSDGTVRIDLSPFSGSTGYVGTQSNHPLGIITNNAEVIRATTDGRVGIGTSNPSGFDAKLAVFNGNLALTTTTNRLYLYYASATNHAYLSTTTGGEITFVNGTASPVDRMRLDTTGNLGVGSTAPKTRLQATAATTLNSPVLGSATNAPFYVTNNDPAYGLLVGTSSATGDVWLQAQRTDGTATAYNINLNPVGGRVGIGTSSPNGNLTVFSSAANDSSHIRVETNVRPSLSLINSGVQAWSFWVDTGDSNKLKIGSANGGISTGTPYITTTTGGSVGIGTASPAGKLELANATGAVDFRLTVGSTLYANIYASAADFTLLAVQSTPLIFGTANTERMRIHASGGISFNTTVDPGAGITAAGATFRINRFNTVSEGGELQFCRASDNTVGWLIDLLGAGTGTDPTTMRFIDNLGFDGGGAKVRAELSSRGVLSIVNDLGPLDTDTLAVGFRGAPHNDQTGTTYTFARTDAGRAVMFKGTANATWTVPLSTTTNFPIGTMIIVDNSHFINGSTTVVVQGADGVGIRAANGAVESTTARLINRQLSRGSIATLRKLANRGSTQTVNSITFVGTTATATTAVAHGYNVGDFVEIAGAVQSQYNGTQRINTVGSTTTFTFVMSAAPATNATGTITVRSADLWNITGSFSVV